MVIEDQLDLGYRVVFTTTSTLILEPLALSGLLTLLCNVASLRPVCGALHRIRSLVTRTAAIGAATSALLFSVNVSASDAQFQSRVVGGVNVPVDFAPSVVGILNKQRFDVFNSSYSSYFCAGTVIESEWVLTAAHCLVDGDGNDVSPDSLLITMGASELDGGNETFIEVVDVILHEAFISSRRGDDIALLQLASEAVVEPTPIEVDDIVLNDAARIAGWGALNPRGDGTQILPTSLQGTIVNMVPSAVCNTLYPVYTGLVSSSQLCAGVAEGGRDTCQGDSGGPLYKFGESGELTLAGLTSWGASCARADSPGIYTRTGAYVDWVRSKIDPDAPGVNVSTNSSSKLLSGASALILFPLAGIAFWRRIRGWNDLS